MYPLREYNQSSGPNSGYVATEQCQWARVPFVQEDIRSNSYRNSSIKHETLGEVNLQDYSDCSAKNSHTNYHVDNECKSYSIQEYDNNTDWYYSAQYPREIAKPATSASFPYHPAQDRNGFKRVCDTPPPIDGKKRVKFSAAPIEKDLHECRVCAEKFLLSRNLAIHVLMHAKENLFECQQCSQLFSSQDYLSKHLLDHSY